MSRCVHSSRPNADPERCSQCLQVQVERARHRTIDEVEIVLTEKHLDRWRDEDEDAPP